MTMKMTLLAAVAALALPAAANAIVIGSNDSGNCYPFICNDSGTSVGQSFDYQQVYDAGQFSGAVQFDTITFFAWAPDPSGFVLNGNYAISFSTTTAGIGSGYPITPLANTAAFYNGNLGGSFSGSFSITGSNYVYNPTSGNLVLSVVVTNQDLVPNGAGNGYLQADYTAAVTSRAVTVGSSTFAGGGALVTEFNSSPAVPEPASWALMIGGFTLVGSAMRRRRVSLAA